MRHIGWNIHYGNDRRHRPYWQHPHIRRVLEGKLQVVHVLSLLEPIANRLGCFTDCIHVVHCVVGLLHCVAAQ